MALPPLNPATRSPHWQALQSHYDSIRQCSLTSLFDNDIQRAERYCFQLDELLVDLSKNHFQPITLKHLLNLAEDMQLEQQIAALFAGASVNTSEQRPALHTALRSRSDSLNLQGNKLWPLIDKELTKMQALCDELHTGSLTGSNHTSINTIINIGIGGSDLGPRLVCDALKPYAKTDIRCLFVANVDLADLHNALNQCVADRTLFIVASKSFSTTETLMNAKSARQWLIDQGCPDPAKHFVAVTANRQAAQDFGISQQRIFDFWPWVGGRYSLWSAIGLPIAMQLGMTHFRELLAGAQAMDQHFQHTCLAENLPVLLGLIDIWYSNFFHTDSHAIVPYDHNLQLLPAYLSQLIMESNGKNVDRAGNSLDLKTAPIVWGAEGTNAQHAFFQLLHQGSHRMPIDFLVAARSQYADVQPHRTLVASCLAQSEALMTGDRSATEAHRQFPGNKPSTTIMYDRLTPRVLGLLLALYEHRTYVQACICNINAFDQWGVELGKKLSSHIVEEFKNGEIGEHDASTQQLMQYYLSRQRRGVY